MTGPQLTTRRLITRSLAHRRAQTLVILVVSGLISAAVVFAAGYQHQVQQTIVDATFAGESGNTWRLIGEPGIDLAALLPPGAGRLTEAPVAGRSESITWTSDRSGGPVDAVVISRTDVCAHLVLVAGRCPSRADEVAVSTADAAAYRMAPGDRLQEQATISQESTFTVAGVYRPHDPAEPYWFGATPTGRSGLIRVDTTDFQGDQLITVAESFGGPFSETLDVRIDHTALRTANLDRLRADTAALDDAAVHHQSRLVTGVPGSLDRIAAERSRVTTGLALTLAQLAALVLVVVVLLASVALADQRSELGLARLRGEPPGALRRLVIGRWGAVVLAGWLLGWVPGLAVLGVLAVRLPGQHGLPVGPALMVAPGLTLLIMIGAVLPATRSVLAQPVVALLRSGPSGARSEGGPQLLVDVTLLALAAAGLVVAAQAGTASVLGLIAPSLLAIGVAVLLVRLLGRLAATARVQLTRGRLRPEALLTAILIVRLRGLRIVVVATCLAAAFAVVAVQVQAIGSAIRTHDAEVSTGAVGVVAVTGKLPKVLGALDELDPQHATPAATMTPVVLTRRADPAALRGMYVEPAGFQRVALGADLVTGPETWARIVAPAVDPVTFTGSTVTAEVAAHEALGRTGTGDMAARTGTRADLGLDYLDAAGTPRSVVLGRLDLAAGPAQRFGRAVDCASGCRILRITLTPNGPVLGELRLVSLAASTNSSTRPVDLGLANRWQPGTAPGASLRAQPGPSGLTLRVDSGGNAVAVQHAWLPLVMPVLVAADVGTDADPTLAGPDGRPLRIDPVARAKDAVPRELDGVAVGDLTTVRRDGVRPGLSQADVEIWLSPAALDRLDEVTAGLERRGVSVLRVDTVQQAGAAQRSTAAALTGQIAPGLAGLAAVFAALGIALAISGQRAALARNLAALRLAGLPEPTLRRPVLLVYLGHAFLAVVLGALTGSLGCVLVIDSLPLLPDAPPAIRLDLGLRPGPLLVTVAAMLTVVVVAVLLGVRRVWRGTPDGGGDPR